MPFEWDSAKDEVNQQKHGIAFEDILPIFDQKLVEMEDNRKDYGEKRIKVYGELHGLILCIVYTWRDNKRRIISARIANERERSRYHGKDRLG